MSEKKQVHIAEKKKSDCGCGCIGITEKKAKESKSAVKKPKK
jgi:hypothetical protein